ncbi:hydroxyphenylacetyl-CoA thioesterase PaaI [Pseudaestuariivita atlantica]|uniref:Phenylacetic acid degradation protein PaaD n=1 Tax=Pseudaestuariivita atlantica TaxID=1317121 RepID=A0A0L1JNV6_9RHOB|nr:hydroxyphenylacetyl-CoA thioesterase PaaI [Pseudaestuariivita atlantica]KNG93429.1 phenylacetic acid degradation protein PaaD [Pseudaestuariivita atlantica]
MTPEARAQRAARAMWEGDAASKGLGIEMGTVAPGMAETRLKVEARHLNGHGICHGGFIFTLADTAFALACNSYNLVTVAQQGRVDFIAPGQPGDTLTARAVERHRAGRSGIYDVTVTRDDGTVIAEFRGLSRTIRGTLFREEETDA